MSRSIPALVNHALLVWARDQSGFDLEPVARRLNVSRDRLAAWERGDSKPTVRQAQELARFYHRPFGVFFLPQPPTLPPLAAEYRRLSGIQPGMESPELRLAIRVMSHRREVSLQLAGELGLPVREFPIAVHLSEPPVEAGRRLREWFGITADEQRGWRDDWQAWRRWREAVEAADVLVFQFPKVTLAQARGLSLLRFPLPVIGINSKESAPGARSFTLLHELTHIALAHGQEERVAQLENRDERAWSSVERFAEEAASAALVPADMLSEFLATMRVPSGGWDVARVRQLATKFRVTPLAMATRLRSAGALSWEEDRQWREEWDVYVAGLKPPRGGYASPEVKALNRSGRPFARLVLEAMDANRITAVEACRYLDLRFDHVQKLRRELQADAAAQQGRRDDGE